MSFEGIEALAQAVDVALRADANLVAHLGGAHVFSEEQPEDLQLDDYVVLDSKGSGVPFRRFNNMPGERLGLTIDVYSRRQRLDGTLVLGDKRVLVTAVHISRILVHAVLPMPSYGITVQGECFLLGTGSEPSGARQKGVVQYEATCRKALPGEPIP